MSIFSFATKSVFNLLMITTLTSCCTILHGTKQSVGISSNPSNATVWVDRAFVGNTPVVVEMSRKDNHIVRIELEGYQPFEAVFSKKVSAWVFGNIVFGGLVGLAVDAVSGGIYMLTPDQVQAEMLQDRVAVYQQSTNDTFITIILEPNPEWQKVGNLVAVQ